MNFKKKVSGSWVDAPYYLKGTDTETITTLPATIYPLAQTAAIGLKGNTVQNGTPTPDNPVPVVGVGDLDNGQYKIPISSASTTTPVYLGEVESTRRIKKYEFTGEEDWSQSGAVSNTFYNVVSGYLRQRGVIINICSHYTSQANINGAAEMRDGNVSFYANASQPWEYFYVRDSNLATVADLKVYLQQQYAAGTPVCVWYVLATEETAVVNEPLMKIGEYADSISGISIPTIAGANTLDVQTTVKPSEVTATFNGWHPVSSAHERSGGAWT